MTVPRAAVWKSLPGWVALSRRHAEMVQRVPLLVGEEHDLVAAWETVWAPEEVYFPTLLSLAGVLTARSTTTATSVAEASCVQRRMVTFADWARKGDANPISFSGPITAEFVAQVRQNHGSLFARKFKTTVSCPFDAWLHAVLANSSSSSSSSYNSSHNSSRSSCKLEVDANPQQQQQQQRTLGLGQAVVNNDASNGGGDDDDDDDDGGDSSVVIHIQKKTKTEEKNNSL